MTRRSFLSGLSLAGAGLVMGAPGILRAQGASDDLNIALIGIGQQGRILLDAMLNIPGLRFQAMCDIWPASLKFGVNTVRKYKNQTPTHYENFEDMLAKEKGLDAVIIATPDFWHAPHTVGCLDAGLHVYCEKMMSNTLEGAASMVQAMDRSKKLCQIGHQRRSNPRYIHTLNNLIDGQKIGGRIVNINGQWNRAVTDDRTVAPSIHLAPDVLQRYGFKDMQQFLNWRWYRDLSGGPISDLGAHQIDIYNWFLGTPPKTVLASGGTDYYTGREQFDNVMAIFEYEAVQGKVRAFYQVLTTTSAGGGYFESFMGDLATIKISENPAFTKVYKEARNDADWDPLVQRGLLEKNTPPAPPKDATTVDVRETAPLVTYDIPVTLGTKAIHQPHLENFFDAIRGKGDLTCDARHAYKSEVCIHKVNPSAEKKELIRLTEADFEI